MHAPTAGRDRADAALHCFLARVFEVFGRHHVVVDLVTTSALLDLVSADWLERFAVETTVRSVPVYAALSYNGRIELGPADPLDAPLALAVAERELARVRELSPGSG